MERSLKDVNDLESITEKGSHIAQSKASTPLKNGHASVQYEGFADDTQSLTPPESKKMTTCSRLKTMTIEPALFTFMFGYFMQMSCITNLMMDKGCRYYYNYSEEVCSNLSNNTDVKSRVEILANDYSMYSNLISLIAALTMIFIAPWSDKYGRKVPLALACIGSIVTDICILLCVLNFESNLFYLVLSKIPANLVGGYICIMTMVFSHASEVSSEKTRTLKYATVEISLGSGMSLGGLLGGIVLKYNGYFYVYFIATVIHIISFLWVVFFVQETTGLDVTETWSVKIKEFFQFDHLSAAFKASVRHRENSGRILLFLFFLSVCSVMLTYDAFGSIGYTYAHHIYDWDPLRYQSVTTTFIIVGIVVLLISIPVLLKICNITYYALGLIGIVSMIGKYVFIAFAHLGVYVFYIGYVIGLLSGVSTLAVRSGISKIVDKDELGKVFYFSSTCETILPMVGTILITKVFNATINVTPSVTYLMTAIILLIPLGTFILALHLSKKQQASEQKTPNE